VGSCDHMRLPIESAGETTVVDSYVLDWFQSAFATLSRTGSDQLSPMLKTNSHCSIITDDKTRVTGTMHSNLPPHLITTVVNVWWVGTCSDRTDRANLCQNNFPYSVSHD